MKSRKVFTIAAIVGLSVPASGDLRDVRATPEEQEGRAVPVAAIVATNTPPVAALASPPTRQRDRPDIPRGDLDGISAEQLEAARLVLADTYLVRAVAEWIGRPPTGYDWQDGLPHRIELAIRIAMRDAHQANEQRSAPVLAEASNVLDDA